MSQGTKRLLLDKAMREGLSFEEKQTLIWILKKEWEQKKDEERDPHHHLYHCPFHEEKTPSFVINTETNTFRCLSCGKNGELKFN